MLNLSRTLTLTLSQSQIAKEAAHGTAAQLKEPQRQLLITEQRNAALSECVNRQQQETDTVRHALHAAQAQVEELEAEVQLTPDPHHHSDSGSTPSRIPSSYSCSYPNLDS